MASCSRLRMIVLPLAALGTLMFGPAWAEKTPTARLPIPEAPPRRPEAPPYTLTVSVREWISQGRSAHNISAPSGSPNVISELTWRGLNSTITQVRADAVFKRFVADLCVGYGALGSGTLLDQDWEGDNRTNKTAETLSSVTDGSVLTVSVDGGWRMFHWTSYDNPLPGGIDLLVGYQYWRERYVGSGLHNLLTDAVMFTGVTAITQTNTWQSFRLGTRAIIPLHARMAIKGSAFYIPVSRYENEDIHHLRTDLRQNPSFLTTATGGNGIQLEGSVLIRVWERLMIEAGYAYWDIRSGSGSVQALLSNGLVVVEPHNDEHTRRQGVFFGINWTF